MATEKKITSRIQQKHDVAANWAKATNFIPKKGEIIIYDAEYNASGEETQAVRFKIGDGSKTVNNLPFAVIDGIQKISGEFYFLKTEDGSIVGINNRGVMIMSKPNNPSLFIVGKEGDMDLYAALKVQSSGDVTSPSTITIGLGEPTVVQLEGQEAGSAKQVFTSQGSGATPKWTSVVNSLNGNTGDITGIATTSQLDNKQDKITSSNKLSSSLVSDLGAAAEKAVDTVISANSTSTNLPTSKAVEDRINAHSGIDKVGTVTGVKMNGTTKNPSSGVVDIGTVLTKHQSIKSINTNNTAAQSVSPSEAIVGTGTINLHKIAKTGNYNDLLDKLTAGSNITINENNVISAKDTTYTFTANNPTLAWNTTSKIGTIGGVEFNVTMPANPNTNTATAADNILDGSNSGTQITYKPYTSQQSKLSFDTSTTNPTRTDRLNLNGYLYATKLYSGGKEVLTSHQDISGKLDKTTYEWNKEFAAGSNGAISLGRYNVYDSQLTFDISSTTSISMNGKLVIATQNGRIAQAKVFGDATGVLVSKIVIYQSAITNNRSWIEVFCNFDGWSKNKVHIYGVALESATVTNQMSSVTFTNGVPSPITNGDSKWSGTIDNDSPIFNYNSSTKTLTISL